MYHLVYLVCSVDRAALSKKGRNLSQIVQGGGVVTFLFFNVGERGQESERLTMLRAENLGSIVKVKLSGNTSRGTAPGYIPFFPPYQFLRPLLRCHLINTAAHFNIKQNAWPHYWFVINEAKRRESTWLILVWLRENHSAYKAREMASFCSTFEFTPIYE